MVNINCNLFGSVSISENGRDVFVPVGKVSGVFYYILIKKIVTRDELAGMFWPASSEEKAKISLRNALHKIRKSFKEDIILSPNKSILMLNEEIEFYIDTDVFEKDPINNLEMYKGEFLKGFYIKDTIDFEYWLIEMRAYYKEKFVSSLQQKIKEDFELQNIDSLEMHINSLLNIDNYNDTAYLYLMKLYKVRGRYDKIINEYYNLQKTMNEELGIDPIEAIEDLYKEAVEHINKRQKKSKEELYLFYDRDYEMNLIQKNLDEFSEDKNSASIVISGESGVGKTVLKKAVLEKNKDVFKIFEVSCYSVEKGFSYSPWVKIIDLINSEFEENGSKKPILWDDVVNKMFYDSGKSGQPMGKILENKENFNVDLIYNTIDNALKVLSEDKKIIIVIENIQWADTLSIKLLINLILHLNKNVKVLLTKSNEDSGDLDRFLNTLKDLNKIVILELKRFDKTDVGIIVRRLVSDRTVSEKDIDNIYEKSKGNAFFLKEYIELFEKNDSDNLITSKMHDILQEKFSNLNEKEREILGVVATFYGDVSIDLLLRVIGKKAFDVMSNLNLLVRKNILEESKNGDSVMISFVHSAYKEFVYEELSDLNKQIIHKEIADAQEAELLNDSKDITNYIKLKYHYTHANEEVKALKYEIYILNYYLNFNHEVFPNLDDYDLSRQVKKFIRNDKAIQWMNELENKILKVKNSNKNNFNIDEINKIELLFLYSKGRYLIRGGDYSLGVKVMTRVIKQSKDLQDDRTELQGHKQMVIYGIQINEPEVMLNHIIEGIKVARNLKDNIEIGVLYRLYGVYYLMKGNFKQAESLFEKSIEIFSDFDSISNNNSISIAADYNYIGEIRNAECDYVGAMNYFSKAIDLCQNTEVTCLALFYINSGKTSYLMKNYSDMEKYLVYAKDIVEQFDSYWKNSVLDAFLSLCNFIKGEYEKSLGYLKDAVTEAKTINNPRDIGMVYFVQTIIASVIEKNRDRQLGEFEKFLKEPSEYYYYNALRYLDESRDSAEIKFLEQYRQN